MLSCGIVIAPMDDNDRNDNNNSNNSTSNRSWNILNWNVRGINSDDLSVMQSIEKRGK